MISYLKTQFKTLEETAEPHEFEILVILCVALYFLIKNVKEISNWFVTTTPGYIICGLWILATAAYFLPIIYAEIKLIGFAINRLIIRKTN